LKNIFLILILFASTIVVGQPVDTALIIKKIIGKPIKIGDLLVAQNDMPFEMNFDKANIACNELGKGWRLPTFTELLLMYKNKDKIGGFMGDVYWSSSHFLTTDQFTTGRLWIINFFDNIERVSDKNYNEWSRWNLKNHVRAVRSTNVNNSKPLKNIITFDDANPDLHIYKVLWHDDIVGKPIIIDNLEVAQLDLEYGMDWNNAKLACSNLGEGWRLPTKDELFFLYNNKAKVSNLTKYRYWSSTEGDSFHAWSINFTWGESYTNHKNDEIQIRAVRSKSSKSILTTNSNSLGIKFDDNLKEGMFSKEGKFNYNTVTSIIDKPFKISNLEVAQKDFPNLLNWKDAIEACAKLGDGWRLPTKDELNILLKNKDKIGGFAIGFYWSSSEVGYGNAWSKGINAGGHASFDASFDKSSAYYVRAIRTIK
jgi:hypothetical protein